jgi:SpoVK/Ycf46/Vps4 family AAA+-type ATPase
MFSGVPGCGKTSTIKAIANETKRHVIEVHLSDIKTNAQLKHLFYNEELMVFNPVTNKAETLHIPISERLYVIEDIDAMKSVVSKRTANGDSLTSRVEENEDEDDTSKLSYAAFAGFSKSDMNTKLPKVKKPQIADPLDLSTLLNILDGTLEVPGRILCITSNHPERLDDALVRPGRIDMIVNFKKCNRNVLVEMFESFYC